MMGPECDEDQEAQLAALASLMGEEEEDEGEEMVSKGTGKAPALTIVIGSSDSKRGY